MRARLNGFAVVAITRFAIWLHRSAAAGKTSGMIEDSGCCVAMVFSASMQSRNPFVERPHSGRRAPALQPHRYRQQPAGSRHRRIRPHCP